VRRAGRPGHQPKLVVGVRHLTASLRPELVDPSSPATRRSIEAMNERPEDDPGADTGMFRAYVEHDDDADAPTSPGVPPRVLAGVAVVLMIVVLVLILLLI
jgi:hypothetical protein